jgi:hypothetical protein
MKVFCELHAGYLNYGYDPFTARSMRASVRSELKLAELRSECIELLAKVCTVNLSARSYGCLCVRVAVCVHADVVCATVRATAYFCVRIFEQITIIP